MPRPASALADVLAVTSAPRPVRWYPLRLGAVFVIAAFLLLGLGTAVRRAAVPVADSTNLPESTTATVQYPRTPGSTVGFRLSGSPAGHMT